MYKLHFFALVIALHLVAWAWLSAKNKHAGFLLVSLYVISIPLQIQLNLKTPAFFTHAGTLGSEFFLPFSFFLFVLVACFRIGRLTRSEAGSTPFNWITVTCVLIVISLFNPNNQSPTATLIFALFFVSNVLLFKILSGVLDYDDTLKGVFYGLAFLTVVHMLLAILFPILNVEAVTGFFKKEGQESATRYGSRASAAIGTLVHPNSLALFTNIASSFFLSCWFNRYRTRASLVMLVTGALLIVLTFSRSSYLAFLCIMAFLWFVHKNARKNFLTLGNVAKFVLPVGVVLAWVVFFSPFSDMFLQSDASDQLENRVLHWLMALEGFYASPLIGVGMNAHLEFFADHYYLISHLAPPDFFLEHQVHNIHFIMLLETGLLGFAAWMLFLGKNMADSKKDIARGRNQVLALTQMGLTVAIAINGFTDWAPFSSEILPAFLFINFLAINYREAYKGSPAGVPVHT
jgi:hypothetical protein